MRTVLSIVCAAVVLVSASVHAQTSYTPDDIIRVVGFEVSVEGLFPGGGPSGSPSSPSVSDGSFTVSVDGLSLQDTRVVGVEIDDLVVETNLTTAGLSSGIAVHAPGDVRPGNVTLRVLRSPSMPLHAWWADIKNGAGTERDVTITILDRALNPARQFLLRDCLPVGYAPGELGQDITSLADLFTLAIGRVELGGGSTGFPDRRWAVASGGFERFSGPESQHGGETQHHSLGAPLTTLSPVTLSGPMTQRTWIGAWFSALEQGQESKRTLTIQTVLTDGETGPARTYLGAFPVRYVYPKLDANQSTTLEETLVFQADVMVLGDDPVTAATPPSSADADDSDSADEQPESTASVAPDPEDSEGAPALRPVRPTLRKDAAPEPATKSSRPAPRKR